MQVRKLAPGDRILDYRILERLGEGGFGEVFRAQHEVLGKIVAIKVPRGDAESLTALRHEGVVQSTLDHPSIVRTLEVSISHDPPFVVFEHVDGLSLAEVLKREGPLPWRRAVRILLDAAKGLAHAHERGVVHGDVKPGNVLVEPGDDGRVRLTDFGLGRVYEGPRGNLHISRSLELASTGAEVAGTLRYLAPEVQRGEPADERADIYSFGVLLFETLTAKIPEGRELPSDLVRGEVPRELDEVFERCFTRREKRPRSLDLVITSLERLHVRGPCGPNDVGDEAASTAIPYKGHDGTLLVKPLGSGPEDPVADLFGMNPFAPQVAFSTGPVPALPIATGGPPPPLPALQLDDGLPDPFATRTMCPPGVDPFMWALYKGPAMPAQPGAKEPASARLLALDAALHAASQVPSFARFEADLVARLARRFPDQIVPAHGFAVGVGAVRDGEPQHRIYTLLTPWIDLSLARRLLGTADAVFEAEKGVWEKEVTFVLVAQEVRDRHEVLELLRAFSAGWWRRRRIVLVDLPRDKTYAAELGCDVSGTPLKRAFFAGLQDDLRAARATARPVRVCRGPSPLRAALGALIASVTAIAILGGAVRAIRSVEAKRINKRARAAAARAEVRQQEAQAERVARGALSVKAPLAKPVVFPVVVAPAPNAARSVPMAPRADDGVPPRAPWRTGR